MDSQRFDAIARLFAGGMPRRGAVKTLLGVGAAAIATQSAVQRLRANTCDDCGGNCTPRGEACDTHDDCCGSDTCIVQECAACLEDGNTSCLQGAGECCPGLTCRDEGPGFSCQSDKNPDKKHKKKHKKR
jgi:hypothetical protein